MTTLLLRVSGARIEALVGLNAMAPPGRTWRLHFSWPHRQRDSAGGATSRRDVVKDGGGHDAVNPAEGCVSLHPQWRLQFEMCDRSLDLMRGTPDPHLVRVLGPIPEPALRHAPHIAAFFDFIVAEIDTLRPTLTG